MASFYDEIESRACRDFKIPNAKSEIRNNIETQMVKIENSPKQRSVGLKHWNFGFSTAFMPCRFGVELH